MCYSTTRWFDDGHGNTDYILLYLFGYITGQGTEPAKMRSSRRIWVIDPMYDVDCRHDESSGNQGSTAMTIREAGL